MSQSNQPKPAKSELAQTWVNPKLGASEEDFHKEILSKIPAESIGDNGEQFSPQQVALDAFKNNRDRQQGPIDTGSASTTATSRFSLTGKSMPGYQEVDSQVSPEAIQVSVNEPDQTSPVKSIEVAS